MVITKPFWALEAVLGRALHTLARCKPREPSLGMELQLASSENIRYLPQKGKEHVKGGSTSGHHTYHEEASLMALLKRCSREKNLLKGSQLHADILRTGLFAKSIFVGSTIIDMYAKCGALTKAQEVLHELPVRDTIAWNALIAGQAHQECGEDAFSCYLQMQHEGVSPDPVTFACVLKACAGVGALEKGKWIHAEVVRCGFLGKHLVVANALVAMYAKCGALAKAQQVFDELHARNVVAWTALITGYCLHDCYQEALTCLETMQQEGLSPNAVTFASALKACASIKAVEKGQKIHKQIATNGLLTKDIVLGNALMVMYAKCGDLVQAREVFNGLAARNIASWTGLITGYCQHGHGQDAIFCFDQMKKEGFSPSVMTFSSILKACATVGAVGKGREVHTEIARKGLLGNCTALGNALIDMYAKCGVLAKAQEVFDKLSVYDVVSWTALIAGYCEQGQGEEAVNRFEGMKQNGFSPDAITYSCMLKACGSMGEAEQGQMYFETVSRRYGIVPSLQHLTNMVVLFGLQGQFDKVMALLKKMPGFDCLSTVINACQRWGNTELARLAFNDAVHFNEKPAVAEDFMSRIMESQIAQKWFAM